MKFQARSHKWLNIGRNEITWSKSVENRHGSAGDPDIKINEQGCEDNCAFRLLWLPASLGHGCKLTQRESLVPVTTWWSLTSHLSLFFLLWLPFSPWEFPLKMTLFPFFCMHVYNLHLKTPFWKLTIHPQFFISQHSQMTSFQISNPFSPIKIVESTGILRHMDTATILIGNSLGDFWVSYIKL